MTKQALDETSTAVPPAVELQRLLPGRFSRAGDIWAPGYLVARVDGHKVSCTSGQGWMCSCTDETCRHLDAVASVLDPELLAELDADDTTEFQQRRLHRAPPPRKRRSRTRNNSQEFTPTAPAATTTTGDTK